MKKHSSSRLLSLLLAVLLCAGLFGVLPGTAASTQVGAWDAAALAAAATATGTDNGAGSPIFTTENQPLGIQLTSNGYRVPAGDFAIPIYDEDGTAQLYAGDTIKLEIRMWVSEEELANGAHAARMRLLWPDSDSHSYNDKVGVDQPNMATAIISRDNYRNQEIELETHPVYGYEYKTFSMEYTLTDDDMERLGDAKYIKASVAGQGGQFKLYYMAAYNASFDMLLNETDQFYSTHETTRGTVKDFSYEVTKKYQFLYWNDDQDAVTNIVTYTNAWGPRAESNSGAAYETYHAPSSEPTVLVDGLTQSLKAGSYRYAFTLNTQLVCDAETPVVTVRAMGKGADGERRELAHYDYTAAESAEDKMFFSYSASDWTENIANNWGAQYSEIPLDFELSEEMEVDFEVVVYNNADVRLRSVNLTREVTQAETQGTGLAEDIDDVGEITPANCLTMVEELEALKADVDEYIEKYGQDKANLYITNQAALATALEQANTLKQERLQKRDAVQQSIDAAASLTITEDNYEECIPTIQAAEAALAEYLTAYGETSKADLTSTDALEQARKTVDEFANKPDVLHGDINGDGDINASDALQALQHSVNLLKLEGDQALAADVNLDEAINASDALLILQYSVDLIQSLPVEA